MQARYGRHLFCICIALCLVISILGNIHDGELALQSASAGQSLSASMDGSERYMRTEALPGVDDFHIAPEIRGPISGAPVNTRGPIVLFVAAAFLMLLCLDAPRRRICFGEKQIPAFRVVTFIHWTDGKKKSCFDAEDSIQNRRLRKWKWEQNIKYCPLMRKRKYSII